MNFRGTYGAAWSSKNANPPDPEKVGGRYNALRKPHPPACVPVLQGRTSGPGGKVAGTMGKVQVYVGPRPRLHSTHGLRKGVVVQNAPNGDLKKE